MKILLNNSKIRKVSKKLKKIISLILVTTLFCTLNFSDVYADTTIRGIFQKQQEITNYGIELMDMENSKAFEIYMALLSINTDVKELKIDFDEPVILDAKLEEDIKNIDSDKLNAVANDTQIAMDAFKADYPEIFWFNISTSSNKAILSYKTNSDGSKTFMIKGIRITFDIYSELEENLNEEYDLVVNKLNSVVEETKGLNRYDTLKYFHDYLINNVEYGLENFDVFDMHGALVNGIATCEGYAESFKALCDLAEIPCVLVRGKSLDLLGNEENHMWNYCLMEDDKWYAVDVTWDDTEFPSYDFFLVGSKTVVMSNDRTFFNTHLALGDFSFTEIHEFTYPTLNDTAYEVIEFMYGDLNSNMTIEAADALEVLKISARLKEGNETLHKAADVDGNNITDSSDALLILKYAARLIESFPVENI